jgi:hypothetical protein
MILDFSFGLFIADDFTLESRSGIRATSTFWIRLLSGLDYFLD